MTMKIPPIESGVKGEEVAPVEPQWPRGAKQVLTSQGPILFEPQLPKGCTLRTNFGQVMLIGEAEVKKVIQALQNAVLVCEKYDREMEEWKAATGQIESESTEE